MDSEHESRSSITALQTKVQAVVQPSKFPTPANECITFALEKMANVDKAKLSLTDLLKNLRSQVKAAMTSNVAKKEHSEIGGLMKRPDAFLGTEANVVDITVSMDKPIEIQKSRARKSIELDPNTTYDVCHDVSQGL